MAALCDLGDPGWGDPWNLSCHCSVVGVVFWLVWFWFCVFLCVFVFLFFWGVVFGVLVCFVLFCVLDDRDSTQDYVSVLHQFTFAATLAQRPTHYLINQLITIATCS